MNFLFSENMESSINNFLVHRITIIIEEKCPDLMDPSIMSGRELVDYFVSKKNKSGYKQPKYNDKNKKPIVAIKKEVLTLLARIGNFSLNSPEGKWAKAILSKYKDLKNEEDGFYQSLFAELMQYTSFGDEKIRKIFINFLIEISKMYAIGMMLGVKNISYNMVLMILYMSRCESALSMFMIIHKKFSINAEEEKRKKEESKKAKSPTEDIITEEDFEETPSKPAAKKVAPKKIAPVQDDNFSYVDDEEC